MCVLSQAHNSCVPDSCLVSANWSALEVGLMALEVLQKLQEVGNNHARKYCPVDLPQQLLLGRFVG